MATGIDDSVVAVLITRLTDGRDRLVVVEREAAVRNGMIDGLLGEEIRDAIIGATTLISVLSHHDVGSQVIAEASVHEARMAATVGRIERASEKEAMTLSEWDAQVAGTVDLSEMDG